VRLLLDPNLLFFFLTQIVEFLHLLQTLVEFFFIGDHLERVLPAVDVVGEIEYEQHVGEVVVFELGGFATVLEGLGPFLVVQNASDVVLLLGLLHEHERLPDDARDVVGLEGGGHDAAGLVPLLEVVVGDQGGRREVVTHFVLEVGHDVDVHPFVDQRVHAGLADRVLLHDVQHHVLRHAVEGILHKLVHLPLGNLDQ